MICVALTRVVVCAFRYPNVSHGGLTHATESAAKSEPLTITGKNTVSFALAVLYETEPPSIDLMTGTGLETTSGSTFDGATVG